MKKLITTLCIVAATCCIAQPYELVNDANGYSYIQINEDLESFKFTSDFKSIGNSGIVGYYVNGEKSDTSFSKKSNELTISDLKTGDQVAFWLLRKNGDLIKAFTFENFHEKTYIAFDKNGGGKDEWMSIDNIETKSPSGQPLPFMPLLLFGLPCAFLLHKRD